MRTARGNAASRRRASADASLRPSSCVGATGPGAWRAPTERRAVMWHRHHGSVPVGVIDVGSNTVRLKVAHGADEIISVREMLRLGAEVEEHGLISAEKLAETADVVHHFSDLARAEGATDVEVLITSPGRQAENGQELLETLAHAGTCSARILSSVEEGLLAFNGALSVASPPARRLVAVVDVGGGSAQGVVGSRPDGPTGGRSVDIGPHRPNNPRRG